MEQTLKNYLVKSIDSDELDAVHGLFDSKEKAEAFLNRFKTFPKDLKIVEIPLNPKYIVNKLADPYYVSFKGKEKRPFDCGIYNFISQAEEAEKEAYKITFYDGFDLYDGVFGIMLFAASKKEAIANGIKKRDEVIASGEWNKAYLKSQQ